MSELAQLVFASLVLLLLGVSLWIQNETGREIMRLRVDADFMLAGLRAIAIADAKEKEDP